MDLCTLERWTQSSEFDFARFLDLGRLIWANACVYNPAPHIVHDLSVRLAALFDERVVEMQTHPDDECPSRILTTYGSINSALSQMNRFDIFATSVDEDFVPGYTDIVIRPICFNDIHDLMNAGVYVCHHDLRADLQRIVDNGVLFNGHAHIVTVLAKDLESTLSRLWATRAGELQKPYMVTCPMRQQLYDNIFNLTDPQRLQVVELIGETCLDAIEVETQETSSVILDAMCLEQFIKVDCFVRRLIAE